MTAPIIDYGQRAGAQPMPDGWVAPHPELAHTRDEWESFLAGHTELSLGAAVRSFYADISEFQPVINSRYPYRVFCHRLDTGYRIDYHAQDNSAYVAKHPDHIEVNLGYVVMIKGQAKAQLARLKNAFGSQAPYPLVPMQDMESGQGFAGPGNHSAEANDLMNELVEWAGGDRNRGLGYANSPDWSGNWSQHPGWLKRSLAFYSSAPTPSGFYARQYYGALPYSVPAGYPTSCAPFGSYVDMNVIPKAPAIVADDFGLDWLAMTSKADLQAMLDANFKKTESLLAHYFQSHDGTPRRVEVLAAMGAQNITAAKAREQFVGHSDTDKDLK